jgi:hypothetical protein
LRKIREALENVCPFWPANRAVSGWECHRSAAPEFCYHNEAPKNMKLNINPIATVLIIFAGLPLQHTPAQPPRELDGLFFQNQEESWQQSLTRAYRARMHWLSQELENALKPGKGFPAPTATTGPSTWNGGTGNWSDGTMWTPVNPPNSAGADVSVDGGNTGVASSVAVDGNFTVGRLTIDVGDAVTILDNRILAFTNTGGFTGAGSIVNNGNLTVTTRGNLSTLRIDSAVTLTGSGAITLTRDPAFTNSSNARIAGGGTLTNSSTIQGEGNLGANETAFVNLSAGIIQANVAGRALIVDPNSAGGLSNAGIFRATNGGVMQLTGSGGGDFINTATGSIQANGSGSEVQLSSSARISGGTLSTSLGGIFRTLNGHLVFLDNLTNAGNFLGNDNSTTALSGAINNTGDFRLVTQGNLTNLRIDGAVTLSGSGTVTLDRDSSSTSSSNSRIAGSGTLTNGNTIQGEGNVGANETGLINQSTGIIQANVAGRVLVVDPNSSVGLSNAGILRATNGGVMQLTGNGGGDFINTGNGSIQANGAGSEVQLHTNARISGGTLSTSDGGIFRTLNGHTVFLDSLTNSGTFIGNDNSSTVISGTITNTGGFTFSTDGNFTNLRIDTAATLAGMGAVTLTRNAAATASSNARIAGAGTLTNQSTIQGEGFVGANETTIINQAGGIIQANVSGRGLQLDPASGTGTFTNQGLLRAISGGILQLTGNGGGTFNNAGGIIRAEAGSEVQLFNGVTISGGTLGTTGAGALLHTLNGHTITLDNLTIAGTYTGSDNSTTILTGAINNTGDITITSDGNLTNLRVNGTATLQSGGTVTLTRNPAATSSSNARIDGTGTLTNASTIQGEGFVAANQTTIVNQAGGIIQANVSGRALLLDAVNTADGFSNAGILRATTGGILQFSGAGGGDFTNTGAGSIQANGTDSQVQLFNGATIHGGTLSTSNGGVIRTINGHAATLDSVTNNGAYVCNDNSSTFLVGSLVNNGDLTITSDGNFTDLRIDGNVTLSGIGAITLTRNAAATTASNARIRGGGTLTNATTIQGEGFVGANEMFIVNQAGGVVQANIAGRALVIDTANAANSFSNSGTFQAINGGILQLSGNGGGDFNNTGAGTIQAIGAGSEVQLINNATIRGGTLISSGGGLFRTSNGQTSTLDSVTNPGNYIANDNSTTFLVGTINNTGDMTFTTDGNFTNLRIDGNVTLTGSGTVTLARNSAVTTSSNARILGGGTLSNASTIQGEGNVGANQTSLINNTLGVIQGNVIGRALVIDPGSAASGLTNSGTLRASNGGTLLLTGNGSGSFTNNIGSANGIFEALNASSLFMDGSAVLTNNIAGVLTLGSYRAIATGNGATLTIRGANITSLAENTEVILSGAGSVFQVGTTTLESTLTMIDGALRILDNRDYTNVNGLTNSGIMQLGGGTFNAPGLTLGADGELFGFGNVTPRPTNSGLIRSVGGTLAFAAGIQGGSGTVQSDAGSTLSVSGGTQASSADFLHNNGNLALGSNNFTVGLDYTNANFGVGNGFDPRANVSGAGLILAFGNVAQTLTGNVTGGTTSAALLAFGNVHVGDTTTLNYQINNIGTSGPSLRGALQTLVNGGNITDGRLGGIGVTASNFGPIALGANSGDLAVTFNATSAGALNGQTVHVINNFDNVGEQNLAITGAAFRFANPTPHTPEPVAFGNFHVGDAVSNVFLSVMNNVPNDGFSESLNAAIGNATGGVLTNGGAFTGLAAGATNNSSLSVGISTATAGSQNGTATITFVSNGNGSSGLGLTNLDPQTVNVTGAVFRYASPSVHTPEPVTFGIVHVGDTVTGTALSITNNATNDGFSESLNGSIGGGTNGVTASGSFTGLAPGSTNNSSLVVGINTATAGTRNGTATIGLVSNGTGSSGLGLTTLGSQTVNVTGQVNFYADPILVFQSGTATLIMNSATSFTLDFGVVQQNSGTYLGDFAVMNFLHHAIFQDTLGGSWNISMVDSFQLSGFTSFSGIGPDGSVDPSVSFDSSMALGTYANTVILSATSSNASGTSSLGQIQLTLQGQVAPVPEPGTWLLMVTAIGVVFVWRRLARS